MRLTTARHGRIAINALVRDHELELTLESPGKHAATANTFVEVEDLRNVTRLVLEGHDIRGEVFEWSKRRNRPRQFTLFTQHGWWMLEASDVSSVGRALDSLFREPSIAGLAERARFIYGRI